MINHATEQKIDETDELGTTELMAPDGLETSSAASNTPPFNTRLSAKLECTRRSRKHSNAYNWISSSVGLTLQIEISLARGTPKLFL
jgi:hypothetical protein